MLSQSQYHRVLKNHLNDTVYGVVHWKHCFYYTQILSLVRHRKVRIWRGGRKVTVDNKKETEQQRWSERGIDNEEMDSEGQLRCWLRK